MLHDDINPEDAILHSIAEIDERLQSLPPAISNGKDVIKLPTFNDGLSQYSADIFSGITQEHIVAFAGLPVAVFTPKARGSKASTFEGVVLADTASTVSKGIIGWHSRFYQHWTYGDRPLKKSKMYLALNSSDHEIFNGHSYGKILNQSGLNRLPIPDSFSSLQLYAFFQNRNFVLRQIVRSAEAMMDRLGDHVTSLSEEDSLRSREGVLKLTSKQTSIAPETPILSELATNWGLRQRIGLFESETDAQLAAVFYEVVAQQGHLGQAAINNAVDKACYERGI